MPILDSSIYDCILDVNGVIYKIQIKATQRKPIGNRRSINVPLNNSKSLYTKESVDFFAVYSEYYGGFFNFPNIGNMQSIRLSLTGVNKVYFCNFDFSSL